MFNDRLVAGGHWVVAGGLASPTAATVIDARCGRALFTDGPFLESKEHLSGFWIIEAPSLDVVRELAVDGSERCNRRLELHPFLERRSRCVTRDVGSPCRRLLGPGGPTEETR